MKFVTQTEVASQLGISRSAVAKAFHPTLQVQLSPQRRQSILKTAERLGYVPNRAARRMARARFAAPNTSFDQIGFIYLVAADEYVDLVCLEMMRGAEHELSKLHASLLFVRVGEDGDWEKVRRLVQAGGVDGWLLVGTITDDAVNRLQAWRQPFVILGDHRCTQPVHSVNLDHYAVGHMGAQHLAALGHRRIGFIGGSLRYVYQQETLAGFKSAVRELGLEEDEQLFIRVVLRTNKGLNEVREWILKLDPKPTAFFDAEVGTANPILAVLRELHFEVPQVISLIASEDKTSDTLDREHTRIELPITDLGNRGALLLHKVASEPCVAPVEMKISPSLIQGWSSVASAPLLKQQR